MLLPRLHDVSLTRLPPLPDVRDAVERDVRGLWAGFEALGLHQLPAANEPTFAPELDRVMQRGWRPPLGWVSLAVAGAVLAGVGFAQMKVQRHLAPSVRAEAQKARASKQKKLPRARFVERTNYSRGN
jgi:hypothetical protein